MRTSSVAALLVAVVGTAAAAGSAAPQAARPAGNWSGTFQLPSPGRAIAIGVAFRTGRATVSLQQGHVARAETAVVARGASVRFRVPGRPAAVVFSGRVRGGSIRGSVTQGSLRGTFRLRRGGALESRFHGLYTLRGGRSLAVGDDTLLPMRVVDLDSGEIHGLYRRAPRRYDVGAGVATRRPVAGTLSIDSGNLTRRLRGRAPERGARVGRRQLEVRFRSGNIALAGTLTLPNARRPYPAVALVHPSGATPRAESWALRDFYVRHGIAVLSYDKRGINQSGGSWPGEATTETSIDLYARDAEAAARFLRRQPDVDRNRVGLSGVSQAGWIMPLAAAREPAVRFLVLLAPPVVAASENAVYQELTTAGESVPTLSAAEIDARVRAAPNDDTDPVRFIRSLRMPCLWVFAGKDMHVATRVSVERLAPIAREAGRDFSYVVLPNANHGLLETARGLNAEARRSSRLARELFPALLRWLRARDIAR